MSHFLSRYGPISFYTVLLVISGLYFTQAIKLGFGTWRFPGAGTVPAVLGASGMVVSSVLLIQALSEKRNQRPASGATPESNTSSFSAWMVLLALLTYPLTLPLVGHVVSMTLTGLIIQFALGIRLLTAVITALCCALLSFYFFVHLLQIPLPSGKWL